MTTTVRTTVPAHWEAVGRMTLAASTLLLGGASAWVNTGGNWAGLLALNVLVAVAWAVVWPEKASRLLYPAVHWHALAVASAALVTAFVVSVFVGSPLLFGAWVGGIAVAMTVLLAVAPRERSTEKKH